MPHWKATESILGSWYLRCYASAPEKPPETSRPGMKTALAWKIVCTYYLQSQDNVVIWNPYGAPAPCSLTFWVPRHFRWVGARPRYDWGARLSRSPGGASRAALPPSLQQPVVDVRVRRVLRCAMRHRTNMCLAGGQTPRARRARSPKQPLNQAASLQENAAKRS